MEKIHDGLRKTANLVKVTLGPKGRNVIIKNPRPRFTKDGVSVIKSFSLSDPEEQIGLDLAKLCAQQTVERAGDATTTTTVLFDAIVRAGARRISLGANPMVLRREIDAAVQRCLSELNNFISPVSGISALNAVAMISSNGNQQASEKIADAVHKVGPNNTITIESRIGDPSIGFELRSGYEFDRGLVSQHFISGDGSFSQVFDSQIDDQIGCYVWILPTHLGSMRREKDNFIKAIDLIRQTKIPLVILCSSIDGDYLKFLATLAQRKTIQLAVVQLPGYGEERQALAGDLAAYCGCELPDLALGERLFDEFDLSKLGKAKYFFSDSRKTVIEPLSECKAGLERRLAEIDSQAKIKESEFLKKRKTLLTTGIGNLVVFGRSTQEQEELFDLVEDALLATRCAAREGVIIGGGIALFRLSQMLFAGVLGSVDDGTDVLAEALREPVKIMCENAGLSYDLIANAIESSKNFNIGFNFATNRMEDLFSANILDASTVVKESLRNSSTFACQLLSSSGFVL